MYHISCPNHLKLYLNLFCMAFVVIVLFKPLYPMQELKKLKTDALIDMLAKLTAQYTDKMAKMNSVELSQFEYDIALIQGELNSRIKREIPQSETQRIFSKIKDVLPLWRRYLLSSKNRKNPGFT